MDDEHTPLYALGPCVYYTDNNWIKKLDTNDWILFLKPQSDSSDTLYTGAVLENISMRASSDIDVIGGQAGVKDTNAADYDGAVRVWEISGRYVGSNADIIAFANRLWQLQSGSQYDTDGYKFLQRWTDCWPVDYCYKDGIYGPYCTSDKLPSGWSNPLGMAVNVYVGNVDITCAGGSNTITWSATLTEGNM